VNLTIVKDCHTTADRPNFKAGRNIKFHNWLWGNLTPAIGEIQMKEYNNIEKNVPAEARFSMNLTL
jgi:hypothetical protein